MITLKEILSKDGRISKLNKNWYSTPPIRSWWMSSLIEAKKQSKALKFVTTNIDP